MAPRSALPPGLGIADPDVAVATVLGAGLLPWAPGTWGSLAALPLAWALHLAFGAAGVLAAIPVVFFAGWWAAEALARRTADHDPGYIVVDEVAGQLVVLAALPPDALLYGIAFVLFRLFDIAKPALIGWADRHVGGGLGVMLDDLFAGTCGAAVLFAVTRFWTP